MTLVVAVHDQFEVHDENLASEDECGLAVGLLEWLHPPVLSLLFQLRDSSIYDVHLAHQHVCAVPDPGLCPQGLDGLASILFHLTT